MVSFTTHKTGLLTGVDGYTVQFAVDAENARQIADFLAKHVNGELIVTVERPKKKRTITANNYLWALCDQIGKAIGTDRETVYKALIRRVGVFDYVLVKEQVAERFRDNWAAKGTGWFCEEIMYPERGKRQFVCFYGSSVYDTEQMARLLDEAVDEARNVNVKTLTKAELKELKDKWK